MKRRIKKVLRFSELLWDFLPGRRKRVQVAPKTAQPPTRRSSPTQLRYDALVGEMKKTWGLRIRKWRTSTSGCAWELRDEAGNVTRMIESPYPRGPMSCAVFMHEVGHHAIGLRTYRLRCLEEYHAWKWGLEEMERRGFSVTDRVLARRDEALRYAIAKARRRGLRKLPVELVPWLDDAARASLQPKTSINDPRLV